MATSPANSQQPNSATTPKQPATTQEELSHDTGEGIRGGYGDSDQTNGLEGGNQRNTPSEQTDDSDSNEEE